MCVLTEITTNSFFAVSFDWSMLVVFPNHSVPQCTKRDYLSVEAYIALKKCADNVENNSVKGQIGE